MENIYFKMNKAINKNIPNCKCNGLKLGKTGKSFQGKGLKKKPKIIFNKRRRNSTMYKFIIHTFQN